MSLSVKDRPKFITDENVGKLTRLLRLLGFDTVFFSDGNDTRLVNMALHEGRLILTRDTHIPQRRLITGGQVRAMLIQSDDVDEQVRQVVEELDLRQLIKTFTICLEDNSLLMPKTRAEVQDRVPPYVWQTQVEYVECPQCHRIYWKGTHWQAMNLRLKRLLGTAQGDTL